MIDNLKYNFITNKHDYPFLKIYQNIAFNTKRILNLNNFFNHSLHKLNSISDIEVYNL